MLGLLLAVCLGLAVSFAGGQKVEEESPHMLTLRTLMVGTCQELQRQAEALLGTNLIRSTAETAVLFLESLLGQQNLQTLTVFLETVVRAVSEGAASGLNVIAVYVTEILRVTGFDAAHTLPRFTPEGVSAIAQWGLLALIAYWLLTIVLRLLILVAKRVFWLVKTVLALWFFGLIATDRSASAETTAVRLGALVLTCVLLTLLSSDTSCAVENRLSSLEGRLKAVEKRKGE